MSSFKRLLAACRAGFRRNRLQYALLSLLLIIGFMFGLSSPSAMDEAAADQCRQYIGDYLQLLPAVDLDNFAEFSRAFTFNALIMAVVLLAGLHLLGLVFIAAALFYKAFTIGFAVSFLLDYQSRAGMLIVLFSILPQNLLFLLFLLLAAAEAVTMSLLLWQQAGGFSGQRRRLLTRYFTFSVVMFLSVVLSALLQGYFSPILLELYHILS